MFDFDQELARRYGGFTSYPSSVEPTHTEDYGENPAAETDRLLNLYATAESSVLDIGCGAGQTLCRLAQQVKQIWGIDTQADLLDAARQRAEQLGLTNVTLIQGHAAHAEDLTLLPDATFDLALSRRGPNLTGALTRTLKDKAIVIQELVSNFDGYPLGEIFGRRAYVPSNYADQQIILGAYASQGLLPVSCKEYFYEEFFRDSEHLAAYLTQIEAMLRNWHLPPRPYDPIVDRPALELYARYHTTAQGIRLLRQRKIFVLRRTTVAYYPVERGAAYQA